MPKNEMDPAASTQQFRAFAQAGQAEDSRSRIGLIVGAGAALVVLVAVIAVVALS